MAFNVMSFVVNEMVAKSQGATDLTPALVGSMLSRSPMMGLVFTMLLARNEANSTIVSQIKPTTQPPPGAPQSFSASLNNSGQVVISWSASKSSDANITYTLVRTNSTNSKDIFTIQTMTTSVTDANVAAGITYSYSVFATDSSGLASPPSVSANIIIPPASVPMLTANAPKK